MKTAEITINLSGSLRLKGNLSIPSDPVCLVIFSHGSGSSRFSPRNKYVADALNENGMATLLTDLLTEEEDNIYINRFNTDLLTDRLIAVTNEVSGFSDLSNLSIGFFGASTGAASALNAAAQLQEKIGAVVSRGGRPDLADELLPQVKAPTLLIVGSLDEEVIQLNRIAFSRLQSIKDFQVVQGAGHLFEEAGALDQVTGFAVDWFTRYLVFDPITGRQDEHAL